MAVNNLQQYVAGTRPRPNATVVSKSLIAGRSTRFGQTVVSKALANGIKVR